MLREWCAIALRQPQDGFEPAVAREGIPAFITSKRMMSNSLSRDDDLLIEAYCLAAPARLMVTVRKSTSVEGARPNR